MTIILLKLQEINNEFADQLTTKTIHSTLTQKKDMMMPLVKF